MWFFTHAVFPLALQIQILYARTSSAAWVPVIDQTDTGFLNHTDIYLTHLTYQMTDLHLYWFCVDTELITDIIKFMKQSKESVYQ